VKVALSENRPKTLLQTLNPGKPRKTEKSEKTRKADGKRRQMIEFLKIVSASEMRSALCVFREIVGRVFSLVFYKSVFRNGFTESGFKGVSR